MGETSLWERERIARKDVPTLQEAFAWCDRGTLVRAVVEDCALPECGEQPLAPTQRGAMEREVAETLDEMCRMSVKRKKGRDSMVMPVASFAVSRRGDAIVRRVGARWITLDDLSAITRVLSCAREQDPTAMLPRRSYALAPWKRLLASRVWLGGPWNVGDRHRALAAVFWGMTHFGFTAEDVEAGQKEWLRHAEGLCGPEDEGRPASGDGQRQGPVPTNLAEYRAQKARELGVLVLDPLEADRRRALAACAEELNRAGEIELARRYVWALCRMGLVDPFVAHKAVAGMGGVFLKEDDD